MTNIETIVLDADNVLLEKISPVIIELLTNLSKKTIAEVKRARKKYWALTKIGEITEEENWLGAKGKEGYNQGVFGELSIPKENYSKFLEEIRNSYRIYDGCLNFLNELKLKGIRLYLFSNSSAETIERAYITLNLKHYFKKAFFSHKIYAAKPSREAFSILIKDTGLIPSETLIVDDKKKNIIIAKELNFQTFLFTDKEDYERILELLREDSNE